MTPAPETPLSIELLSLGDSSIAKVAARTDGLCDAEHARVADLFWRMATQSAGSWLELKFGIDRLSLVVRPDFERAFIAAALRVLGRHKLEAV